VAIDGRTVGPLNKTTVDHIRDAERPRPSAATAFDKGAVVPVGFQGFLLRVDDFDPTHTWHVDFTELITARLTVEFTYTSLYGGEKYLTKWRNGEPDDSHA